MASLHRTRECSYIDLEAVPDCLKCGVVVPVYKGGGKDPLLVV